MPNIAVVFFKDEAGEAPALDFLRECRKRDVRVAAKFAERVQRLEELGWELRRPESDTLRDGIHELRVAFGGVNYRLLYSFHREPSVVALLSHGCTKEDIVPPADIDLALQRKKQFEADPEGHTFLVSEVDSDKAIPEGNTTSVTSRKERKKK